MALASGLFTRLNFHTSTATLLGLQALFGLGAGFGVFRLGVSRVIRSGLRGRASISEEPEPLPKATLLTLNGAIFAEMIGGSVGIAAAQAVFVSQLSNAISETRNDMYEKIVLRGGATNFKDKLTGDVLDKVLETFNKALTRTFFVATGAGALPFAIPVTIVALMLTPFGAGGYFLWRRRKRAKTDTAASGQTLFVPNMYPTVARRQAPTATSPSLVHQPSSPYIHEVYELPG